MAPPLALDDGRIAHQARKAASVQRRGHGDQPQVGPQPGLRVERQCQTEIAVEAAFMDFVEQHRRYAGQFGIGLDARDEDAFGDDGHAGRGADLRVHARGIAKGAADRLLCECGHALGGGARGEATGGQEQDSPVHQGWSRRAGATAVVLPAPGGATRTALGASASAVSRSGRTAVTGRVMSER